jgi:hypothetical protein
MDKDMQYDNYYSALRHKAALLDVDFTTKNLRYKEKSYKSIKLTYNDENPYLYLLTAGFHGNEIAGPLTILDRLEKIVEKAKEKDVGLIIYPCINPSGFDIRTRYNISDNGRDIANNDFIRYVVNHKIVDDLMNKKKSDDWFLSSDKLFNKRFPPETNYMQEEMEKIHWKRVLVALDLHQHVIDEKDIIKHACTYTYVFSEPEKYASIIKKIENIAPLLKNTLVDKGYIKISQDEEGLLEQEIVDDDSNKVYTDEYGTIYRHDGTISALADLKKVKDVVAVETTSEVPLDKSIDVNMAWYEGLMDLIKPDKK